jgi:hypothetical protein
VFFPFLFVLLYLKFFCNYNNNYFSSIITCNFLKHSQKLFTILMSYYFIFTILCICMCNYLNHSQKFVTILISYLIFTILCICFCNYLLDCMNALLKLLFNFHNSLHLFLQLFVGLHECPSLVRPRYYFFVASIELVFNIFFNYKIRFLNHIFLTCIITCSQ